MKRHVLTSPHTHTHIQGWPSFKLSQMSKQISFLIIFIHLALAIAERNSPFEEIFPIKATH